MSSPLPFDPYQVLGVARDASTSDIRSAYRKLVLKCHPDKIQDESQRGQAQDEFQKVQESYELLSDDAKRARYDQKVRLAELKKDILEKKNSSSGNNTTNIYTSTSTSSPKTATFTTTYEFRSGKVYEKRTPPDAHFFDEDVFPEEPRSSSRKYDGYERRQATEERKKSRSNDPKVEPVRSTKDRSRDKSSRSDRAKHRDKERKREASDKYSRAYVVSENDWDSDDSYPGEKSAGDTRRSYEDHFPKSSRRTESKRDPDDEYLDDWASSKHDYLQDHARQYIQRSKGTAAAAAAAPPPPPTGTEHRTSSSWPSQSFYERREARDPLYGDTARRSSAKPKPARETTRPNSSGRDRRTSADVVDPPLRSHTSGRKVPSMPTATSAPAGLKIPSPLKSAPPNPTMRTSTSTMHHVREKSHPPPPPRRSETLPIPSLSSRRPDGLPPRQPKFKDLYDSGYSSPGTPEMSQGASPPKSTKYTIVDEDDEFAKDHRTVLIDPSPPYRRQESISPNRREHPTVTLRGAAKPSRTRTTTAAAAAGTATPTATPYGYGPDPTLPRDIPSRHEPPRPMPTLRGSPPLRSGSGREPFFAEVTPATTPADFAQKFPDDQVRYSPKIRQEDISFSHNARKGSLDSHLHRDTYTRSHEQHRPSVMRNESCAY